MKWIWVRHGETEANARGCYLGHTDSPLTSRGLGQVEKTALRLSEVRAARLYTSDLGRSAGTAAVIGRSAGLVPEPAGELRELDFGEWDGKTYEEIVGLDRMHVERWYNNPFEVAPPGGETLLQLGERVDRWIRRELAVVRPDETAIVVTHGGPIRWFHSKHVLGDESAYWKTDGVPPGEFVVAERVGSGWRFMS